MECVESQAEERVIVDRRDGVVTIALNQPRRKNAINEQGWQTLRSALTQIDTGVDRVVVLRGAGDDFCAGADLSNGIGDRDHLAYMCIVNAACAALHAIPVPSVALVDGVAVGAGMNLALACDFVIASRRARFSQIFIKRGLSVDCGGSWLLPRLVGLRVAKEMVLLGDMLSASDVDRLGLVHSVVEVEQLDIELASLVSRLKANPPIAAALSKRLLNDSFNVSLQQALEDEARAQTINDSLDDAVEARDAFLEKREPVFRGI